MTTYAPTTELEAVNVMLGVIGEAPVSSLNVSGFVDVAVAQQILHETSREIQSIQWEANTEYDYPLPIDINGYINLPTNVLNVDISVDFLSKYEPVVRGTKLYDKKNHTFVFPENISCDMVWFLAFTDLPETLRRYITVAAARKFQKRMLSSTDIDGFTAEDEMNAKSNALSADTYVADYNMTQNYAVANILER